MSFLCDLGQTDGEEGTLSCGAVGHGYRAAPAAHRIADDAQAQTGAAHLTGAGLVHPVKALENVWHILVGDPDAVVLHPDHHVSALHRQSGVDEAHVAGIFDAVFHKVI